MKLMKFERWWYKEMNQRIEEHKNITSNKVNNKIKEYYKVAKINYSAKSSVVSRCYKEYIVYIEIP